MRTKFGLAMLCVLLVAAGCGDDDKRGSDNEMDSTVGGECTADGMPSTVGNACTGPEECQDGCYCNGAEVCEANKCAPAAKAQCDDGIECTVDLCDEDTRRCNPRPIDRMCDDNDRCNGVETCSVVEGCVASDPLECDDSNECTIDSCDPATGCVFERRDRDGDGFSDAECGGSDCLDDPDLGGAAVNIEADEVCGNGLDDNCDGLFDFRETTSCIAMNDTCETALEITAPGFYGGATANLEDTLKTGCRSSGPEAVFKLNVTETADVKMALKDTSSGAVISVRPWAECGNIEAELSCYKNSEDPLHIRSLGAGDYAVIVESPSATLFDLELTVEPATAPLNNDFCNDETRDITGGGMFMGRMNEVGDNYHPTCASSFSRRSEHVYALKLDSVKDISAKVEYTSPSDFASTEGRITIVSDCDDITDETTVVCQSSNDNKFRRRQLEPGNYFLIVEPISSTAESYKFEFDVTDPAPRVPGDLCESAIAIANASASFSVENLELNVGTDCDSSPTSDIMFQLDVTEPSDAYVRIDGPGTTTLAIVSDCNDIASDIECQRIFSSRHNALYLPNLAVGTYYVVATTTETSGNIGIETTVTPTAVMANNDSCDSAIVIDPALGYRAVGTLRGRTNQEGQCSSFASYSDSFYTFTLTETKRVTAIASRVNSTNSFSDLHLVFRAGACDPDMATSQECVADGPEVRGTRVLEAGTYFLQIESSTVSDYFLDISFSGV